MSFSSPRTKSMIWALAISLVAAVSAGFAPFRHVLGHKTNVLPTEDGDLGAVVMEMISTGLSDCVLMVAWDATFSGTFILDYLAAVPNPKQMVKVDGSGKLSRILWRARQCRGYVLLLTDPSPLIDLAEEGHHLEWDYSGRFVLAGLSRAHVDGFTRTSKGHKTEHIVGIVKENGIDYTVVTNLLYDKSSTARVFTWPATHQARQDLAEVLPRNLSLASEPIPMSTLFPDKTKNLRGAVLNVITFLFPPSVMYWEAQVGGSKQWFGDNIRLLEAVARVFNFTFRYKEPPPGEMWGELMADGTWNGMVGMMSRGEGDIGLANLFITTLKGREDFLGYTAPYGQERTCFLVKRETPLPRWHSLGFPFTVDTWIAVVVLMLLTGPMFYFTARLSNPRDKSLEESLTFSSLYTFAVHFRGSQALVPTRPSLQVFIAFLWMYVIIITVAYSANLTAFLTVERIPEGITSIKQLFESRLPIYEIDNFYYNSMLQARNKFIKGLTPRFISKMSFEDIIQNILQGRGVYVGAFSHLAHTKSINISPKGAPILRIIQECFQPFNVAMGIQRHSPLKKNFDKVVTWGVETGLVQYWFDEALMEARRRETTNNRRVSSKEEQIQQEGAQENDQVIPLGTEHLEGLFIVFSVGGMASLFVFTVELVMAEFVRRWT